MKKSSVLPYITGITMAVLFGLSFLFSKMGLESLSPALLLGGRFGSAFLILCLLWALKIIKLDLKGKPIRGLVVLSIFYPVFSFMLEMEGLKQVSSSQAGILVAILPVFTMLLGMIILKERPAVLQMICIVTSVLGTLITIFFASGEGTGGSLRGILLLLVSVAAGAVYTVLSRKNSVDFTAVEITFFMVGSGAIVFNLIAIFQGLKNWTLGSDYLGLFHSASTVGAVLYLGIGASVIAFFCMNYTLSRLPAANAAVFMNLATVISILAGVVFLRERLAWYQMLGGLFIILSVWGTNYLENKQK